MTASPVADLACGLCRKEEVEPLGGWVYRDDLWSVAIQAEYEVPGWLVIQTRRHALGPSSMTDEEAASFGAVLRSVTAAIEAELRPRKLYVVAFGENYPHWHILVAPRLREMPDELTGCAVIAARHDFVDLERAVAVAGRLCQRLAGAMSGGA